MSTVRTIGLVAVLAACSGVTPPARSQVIQSLPATLILKVGESRTVSGAVIRFAEVKGDPAHLVPLNTSLEPRSGGALGLRLTLLTVTPVPVSTTPTTGYQAEIRIERIPAS